MSITAVKQQILRSKTLPKEMKDQILKYITSNTVYNKGRAYGLKQASGLSNISKKISGCSFGADKDGFFFYTHRGRSKSHLNPLKITKTEIDWVESTG